MSATICACIVRVPWPISVLATRIRAPRSVSAIDAFDVIQTVDSVDLARRLDGLLAGHDGAGDGNPAGRFPILLQVNVDDDAAKAGFAPADLERDLGAILDLPDVSVDGLMTVGRLVASPELARPTFVALRTLSDRLRAGHPGLGPALSMGMSEDYPIAVEEGATLVRIGRAIFGARPTVG